MHGHHYHTKAAFPVVALATLLLQIACHPALAAPWLSPIPSIRTRDPSSHNHLCSGIPTVLLRSTQHYESENTGNEGEMRSRSDRSPLCVTFHDSSSTSFPQPMMSVQLLEPGSCLVTFTNRRNRGREEAIHADYDNSGKFRNSNLPGGFRSAYYCPAGWRNNPPGRRNLCGRYCSTE